MNTIGLTLDKVEHMAPEELADHLAMSGANRIPHSVLLASFASLVPAQLVPPSGIAQPFVPWHP